MPAAQKLNMARENHTPVPIGAPLNEWPKPAMGSHLNQTIVLYYWDCFPT